MLACYVLRVEYTDITAIRDMHIMCDVRCAVLLHRIVLCMFPVGAMMCYILQLTTQNTVTASIEKFHVTVYTRAGCYHIVRRCTFSQLIYIYIGGL